MDSTSVAVVMSLPIDWLKYGFTIPDVLAAIPLSASYATLRSQVEIIMTTDAANLISDTHPEIWETALTIANAILATAPTPVSKRAPSATPLAPAFIEDVPGPDIVIKNPRAVPYGISSMNIQSCNFSDYAATKTPYWVNGKDWVNMLTASETSVNYALGAGNFVTCVVKLPSNSVALMNAMESAITAIAGAPGITTVQALYDYFSSQPLMEQVRRDAAMKGSQAWLFRAGILAVAFVPAGGDMAAIAGDIMMEIINDGGLEYMEFPVGMFLKDEDIYERIEHGLAFLEQTASQAKSHVRQLAKLTRGNAAEYGFIQLRIIKRS